ncbi:hypothetical protein YB2330_001751 [Saitoella coloradoensis]
MPPMRIPIRKIETTPYEEVTSEPKIPQSDWERTVLEPPTTRYGKYVLGGHFIDTTTVTPDPMRSSTRTGKHRQYIADRDAGFRMLLKIRKLRETLAELVAKHGGPRPVTWVHGLQSTMNVDEELWRLANMNEYSYIKHYKVKRFLERQIDAYKPPESATQGKERFHCKISGCKKKFRTVQGFLDHDLNMHKCRSLKLSSRTACPEPGCVKLFMNLVSLQHHIGGGHHFYSRQGFLCPMPSCTWRGGDNVVAHIVSYHHAYTSAEEYAEAWGLDIDKELEGVPVSVVRRAKEQSDHVSSGFGCLIDPSKMLQKYTLRLN